MQKSIQPSDSTEDNNIGWLFASDTFLIDFLADAHQASAHFFLTDLVQTLGA
jgi:hypothetical protein